MLRKPEQAAIEAVAKALSATWQAADGPPDAFLSVAGKRIAVDVTTFPKSAIAADAAKPRLRFDKVVVGLASRLRADLGDDVPQGRAVLVTVTAPIKLPAKTAVAIAEQVRACLARRAAEATSREAICGNDVCVRVVKSSAPQAAKVIVLVHNRESDAALVLDMTRALLQHVGDAAAMPAQARFKGERWLVIANANGQAHIDAYRQIYAELDMTTGYDRILMVLAPDRVETLAG